MPPVAVLGEKGRHARRARFRSRRLAVYTSFGSLRALAGSAFSPREEVRPVHFRALAP